ncbi:MAG: 3,4-dihydroxy-2-butanone-4-phosphate synthase [Candidatus Bathyarchaeia archaeon]
MPTDDEFVMDLASAISEFRKGKFVLLHDSQSRENEFDLIVASELASPEHVSVMRRDAGGLLCLTVDREVGEGLGLGFLQDILASSVSRYPVLGGLVEVREPYGDRPAFSITINHRKTFTGITDQDRALTIREMGRISKMALENNPNYRFEFIRDFKSPGHVHLLLESEGSLDRRHGHTELSLYLCRLAGLTPSTAICEMLDGKTYRALNMHGAEAYAQEHSLPVIDGEQLLKHYLASSECHVPHSRVS